MKQPQHLLVITVDTLRADYLTCNGSDKTKTPHFDRFAESGVNLAHHLTSIGSTLSSHCSLFSASTPMVNKVKCNGMRDENKRKTLPLIAAENGYQTAAITSWCGFQAQQGYGFQSLHSDHKAASLENRGDKTLERVQEWVAETDPSKPLFLWVHLIDPHTPYNCPEPYPQTYEGSVEFSDYIVGQILKEWDGKMGLENTMTVLTADHGEHLNDHGIEVGHGTLWHTNLWAPLMISSPGHINPGTRIPELVRQIDVMPTILDYLKLPMPYDCQGMSIRGLIEGHDRDLKLLHQGQAFYEEKTANAKRVPDATTIRNDEFSFHFSKDGTLSHVFDTRSDPGEERDLCQGDKVEYSVEHSIKDSRE
ncbi:MAG: sulfatase [Opitutaceae bacterium]|nr:sulfatase [Opitutaceae bacterium]